MFPFGLLIGESGIAAKLLGLFRMPKIIELLDIKRVKKILTGDVGPNNVLDTETIVKNFLYMYSY